MTARESEASLLTLSTAHCCCCCCVLVHVEQGRRILYELCCLSTTSGAEAMQELLAFEPLDVGSPRVRGLVQNRMQYLLDLMARALRHSSFVMRFDASTSTPADASNGTASESSSSDPATVSAGNGTHESLADGTASTQEDDELVVMRIPRGRSHFQYSPRMWKMYVTSCQRRHAR